MKASLSRRLFRTIFAVGLINVLVTLIAVEFIYEDMEDTILRLELAQERAYLEQGIGEAGRQGWHSSLLTAVYHPDGATDELPEIFRGRPVPFSAEVMIGDKTYLISIERTANRAGVLYLAQDISLLESREDVMQVGMTLLGLCMLLLCFALARVGTRRIAGPLHGLSRHIAHIHPGTAFTRITAHYDDEELADIAATLNHLLDTLEAYVQREKSLVSLASHELRTPVAVIAGALDVLEQRNSLGEADRRTVARIRRAADEMRADVETLLKLARRSGADDEAEDVALTESVREVVTELESGAPEHAGRITCYATGPAPTVQADPALVRMLLRNLIQNAIRHTPDRVNIHIGADSLRIVDTGAGLPEHVRARLADGSDRRVPEDGLGLFIVRLICERLQWRLEIRRSDEGGTVLELLFAPPGAPPVQG
ncbi:HAMP domain-containing sensor histidine kinase [Pseudothauera rhizosphaerae]|uniref:histidine kinase n=1 Tax=Pseudothauera rhizosphaerae TaxID=2565932 RepID=A0A4S4AQL1_9RHOO|nr:HAMP domain-containing sensor histidine kinase [Pseudothauera rhizosphaerae]THF61567.1 HAMP domain-containing histidine kinase [Pseudothauera rhizosphaerae]